MSRVNQRVEKNFRQNHIVSTLAVDYFSTSTKTNTSLCSLILLSFFNFVSRIFPQIVYLYSYICTTTGIAQLHNIYLHMHTHWSHPQSNCIKFSLFPVFTAVIPVYKMNLIRLDRYIGSFMITVMVSEILTFLYIVYFIYTEAKSFKALGKKYFKVWICGWYMADPFDLIDLLINLLNYRSDSN